MKLKFAGNEMNLVGEQIKVGDKAPNFVAVKGDLSEYKLSDDLGKVVILSIVPSIDTGVCAIQTRTFNEDATELSKDVKIVTISMDLPFAQQRFCAAEGIEQVELVSDYKDHDFAEKYGFLIKELGLLARGIIIIDKEGKVTYTEIVPEVTHEVNFDDALEEAKKLI